MVLQWDALKAGLVVCPAQRDGGAEGSHVSDNRRVGSGCKWKGRKCIITFEHMYTGDEGGAIYIIMYIQSLACIVGTYTAPVPMQVHWTTLVQSQSTL